MTGHEEGDLIYVAEGDVRRKRVLDLHQQMNVVQIQYLTTFSILDFQENVFKKVRSEDLSKDISWKSKMENVVKYDGY